MHAYSIGGAWCTGKQDHSSEYSLVRNGSYCDGGEITSELSCKAAAAKLELTWRGVGAEEASRYPPGCIAWKIPDPSIPMPWPVYAGFNKAKVGGSAKLANLESGNSKSEIPAQLSSICKGQLPEYSGVWCMPYQVVGVVHEVRKRWAWASLHSCIHM